MRANEIYDGLLADFGEICADKPWITGLKEQYSLNDEEWTAECFFLITVSWGPWKIKRQMQVWNNMKETYPEVIEDIRNAKKGFKGFPFAWQNNRVITLANNLRKNNKSLSQMVDGLRQMDGAKARDAIATIAGAKNFKKTISCFVRDFLLKNTFPLDSRVLEMLACLGLPNEEDQMIKLCLKDKVKSGVLNRMLYSKWEACPDQYPGEKEQCIKCSINKYCWYYNLGKE